MEHPVINHVCVVGCGTMGRQIAMNAAIYGYDVKLFDVSEAARQSVIDWSKEYLAGRVAKGRMTQEKVDDIARRYQVMPTLEEAAKDADLVIETIVEIEEVKKELFE